MAHQKRCARVRQGDWVRGDRGGVFEVDQRNREKALLIRWDSEAATGKRDACTLATLPGVARKRKDEKKRGGKQGGGGGGEEGEQWRGKKERSK